MYWLLDYEKQEEIREIIIDLQMQLTIPRQRDQYEQQFPFNGRKDRHIAEIIIEKLSNENEVVCDPFGGSGIFGYASLDARRITYLNEWEPYAYRLSGAPFRGLPDDQEFNEALQVFINNVKPQMQEIYRTKCPDCGRELMFDGLFFDRDPEEYYNPTWHERMGPHGENVIFRGRYKCRCKCTQKRFDEFDNSVKNEVDALECQFPDMTLIENARLNFTAPEFTDYKNLFSHRQRKALIILSDAIRQLPVNSREFFYDTFLSIIHLAKYVDYRSKSQDNHCPGNRLKETNLYHRFLETLSRRKSYIAGQNFNLDLLTFHNKDFRDFFNEFRDNTIDLILTDPPYGDTAQYFEHAQRVHPFMGYNLSTDAERLSKEVVISNAPSRHDKHGKDQFLNDIKTLFAHGSRVIKTHGYFVLYFRPEQGDWISDLNKLKHYGRKFGFEPLITIPLDNSDPSMRVLASAAWAFSMDICFVFLKLSDEEQRWYEEDTDIDELIYLSALAASDNRGIPFVIEQFNRELHNKLSRENLLRLLAPRYQEKIKKTLERYCVKEYAQYRLTGLSPYNYFHREMNAEIRLREYAPIVIEELSSNGDGFTFEEYIVHLSSYMENGSREIIESLHRANRLIPELLLQYAEEQNGRFVPRNLNVPNADPGKVSIREMDPAGFERLIADYFIRRGFVRANVIGRSCDRGVDILATNAEGELELIQCKRYRQGNNIGSTPIQRVDSYMRSRHAKKAWVVTTSDFTPEGRDEARITGVVLLNGDTLIQSLDLYYPGIYTL